MKSILFIICLPVLWSCHHGARSSDLYSLRDTIVQGYLTDAQSRKELDTGDVNYQLLRAYIKNDTAFFKGFRKKIADERRTLERRNFMDSCVHEPRIQDLPADEAYRFNWLFAFCRNKLDLTISKRDSIFNLHVIAYRYASDTTPGKILSEYDKKLTKTDWEDFKELMDRSDFWDLSRIGGDQGLDGDDIVVWGYIKGDTSINRPARVHVVSRWLVHGTPLGQPFDMVVMLSENRDGCFWFGRRGTRRKRS